MKSLLENLTALVKVKTLVTLCVMSVWTALALSGAIDADSVTNIALMVLSFYFGSQIERQNKGR